MDRAIKFSVVIAPSYLGRKYKSNGKAGSAIYINKWADVIYETLSKDIVDSTSSIIVDDNFPITLGNIINDNASSTSKIACANENEKVNIPNSSTE